MEALDQIGSALDQLRSRADRARGLREAAKRRLDTAKTSVATLEHEDEVLRLVAELFRHLVDREVAEGVQAVERLLTEALQAVFDDQDLSVRADVDIQRGKVSVDLVTIQKRSDGTVIEGLSGDSFGGAVQTVQSVMLRIIVMRRRSLRSFLILDESLPAFDPNYVCNMGKFLSVLCSRLGMDILLVTHDPALVDTADKAYRIRYFETGSKFEEIR